MGWTGACRAQGGLLSDVKSMAPVAVVLQKAAAGCHATVLQRVMLCPHNAAGLLVWSCLSEQQRALGSSLQAVWGQEPCRPCLAVPSEQHHDTGHGHVQTPQASLLHTQLSGELPHFHSLLSRNCVVQIASNWTGGSETLTAAVSDHSQALHSNCSLTLMGCLARVLPGCNLLGGTCMHAMTSSAQHGVVQQLILHHS